MYCPECGSKIENGSKFCSVCGCRIAPQSDETAAQDVRPSVSSEPVYQQQGEYGNTQNYAAGMSIRPLVAEKNIPLSIILSIITCGIYGLYWMACLNKDLCRLTNDEGISGVLLIVLTFVTCGLYGVYWAYQMGQKVERLSGRSDSMTSILFVALQLFGLGIVNYAIMQNEVNNHV